MANCRTCKLYDLDAVKSKSGAVLRNRAAKCLWQSAETWPDSVYPDHNQRPHTMKMRPDEGQRCKRFIKTDRANVRILDTTQDSQPTLAEVRRAVRKDTHADFAKVASLLDAKRQHPLRWGDFLTR